MLCGLYQYNNLHTVGVVDLPLCFVQQLQQPGNEVKAKDDQCPGCPLSHGGDAV